MRAERQICKAAIVRAGWQICMAAIVRAQTQVGVAAWLALRLKDAIPRVLEWR